MPKKHRSELLMPAGSLEKLKAAILYGADAVYMGTPDLSLRVKSKMTLEDVVEGIRYAHERGKKVYLTLNLFSHNRDIDKLPDYVETVRRVKPDGLIIADPGVFTFVKQVAPELKLHISTQANICSWQSVKFWQDLGAELCVLAREVSFEELREIRRKCPDIRLESFVHGSMCMTYSGRCLLSNFMSERGANQGACANSCRWKYKVHMKLKDGTLKELPLSEENLELFEFLLEEECRPGELMPIIEDERGSYILNSKDLNLMPRLDQLLAIGIDSLKVEGRGKSIYYAALTARAYRMAIDDWYKDPENFDPAPWMAELNTIPNRGYTLAFHEGRLSNYGHAYEMNWNFASHEYAGIVRAVEEDAFIIEVKNKLVAGDVLEFISPTRRDIMLLRIYEFIDAKSGHVGEVVHAGEKPVIRLPFALFDREDNRKLAADFPPLSIIRKEKALTDEQWKQIRLDVEAGKMELGKQSDRRYQDKKEALIAELDDVQKKRTPKTRRIGLEGCCGKGCNGCLVFWNDDKYAKARALLAKRKQGEMLERNMREDLIEG